MKFPVWSLFLFLFWVYLGEGKGRVSGRMLYFLYRSASRSYRANSKQFGGVKVDKRALTISGLVYISRNMRHRINAKNSSKLLAESAEKFAICSGQVFFNPITNNATYAMPLVNGTNVTVSNSFALPYFPNATVVGSSSSGLVFYRYFMCPSNLVDNIFEEDDTYCCGPPGFQMCCSEKEFNEQLIATGLPVVLIVFLATLLIFTVVCPAFVLCTICCCNQKCNCLRRASQSSRHRAILFRPVVTTAGSAEVVQLVEAQSAKAPELAKASSGV